VADPAPGPLQLLIGRSAPVGNVDHDVRHHHFPVRRHRPFSAAAGPAGLTGGDHYHGRLTISRRPGRPGRGLFAWLALASAGRNLGFISEGMIEGMDGFLTIASVLRTGRGGVS